jgi:hypothetical protein
MGAGQIAAPYFGLRLETKVGCVLRGFKVYPREVRGILGIPGDMPELQLAIPYVGHDALCHRHHPWQYSVRREGDAE